MTTLSYLTKELLRYEGNKKIVERFISFNQKHFDSNEEEQIEQFFTFWFELLFKGLIEPIYLYHKYPHCIRLIKCNLKDFDKTYPFYTNLMHKILMDMLEDNHRFEKICDVPQFIELREKIKKIPINKLNELSDEDIYIPNDQLTAKDFNELVMLRVVMRKSKKSILEENIKRNSIEDINEICLKVHSERVLDFIFCENKDDEHYSKLNITNKHFIGVKDCQQVFLIAKNGKNAIRDRDFLSNDEVQKIQSMYPNLIILKYYSIENYLYHPDNIESLLGGTFDKQGYIDSIRKDIKDNRNAIIKKIETSRKNIKEINEDNKMRDINAIKFIEQELMSNEFERSYTFFSAKDYMNKEFLTMYSLRKEQLAGGLWMKRQIEDLLHV